MRVVLSDRISPQIDSSKLIVRFASNLRFFLSFSPPSFRPSFLSFCRSSSTYLDTFAALSLLNYRFRRASLRAAVALVHLPDGISGLITRSDAVTGSDRLWFFGGAASQTVSSHVPPCVARLYLPPCLRIPGFLVSVFTTKVHLRES